MDFGTYLVVAVCIVVLYVVYKAILLYNADGDLTVVSSSLKPDYFRGKVVWVTGASSGSMQDYILTRVDHNQWVFNAIPHLCAVGEEMCYQLSKLGAKVILSSRSEDKLERVQSSLANPENAR